MKFIPIPDITAVYSAEKRELLRWTIFGTEALNDGLRSVTDRLIQDADRGRIPRHGQWKTHGVRMMIPPGICRSWVARTNIIESLRKDLACLIKQLHIHVRCMAESKARMIPHTAGHIEFAFGFKRTGAADIAPGGINYLNWQGRGRLA
jgi:hypothetical protein